MAEETPVLSPLLMDRSLPLGNSQGPDGRRQLHVKAIQGLILPSYNRGHHDKPTMTRDVFTYYLNDVLVGTLTIDWETASKDDVVDWEMVTP